MQQYYSILGLHQGATKAEIKKAYRKKVMLYHPDRNPSAEARKMFIMVDRAYDALYYDKYREAPVITRKRKKKQSAYHRWANVHEAPTNSEDYKEWVKIKKEQMKREKSSGPRLTKAEMRRRRAIHSSGMFAIIYILCSLACFLLFTVGVITGLATLAMLSSADGNTLTVGLVATVSLFLLYRTVLFMHKYLY